MATTDQALDQPTGFEQVASAEGATGAGPWTLAMRRLRRNKVALAFGVLFILLVLVAVLAPVWAHDVAHTGPFGNHVTDTIKENGKQINVVSLQGVPIGPQYFAAGGRFFFGKHQGRQLVTGHEAITAIAALLPIPVESIVAVEPAQAICFVPGIGHW